MECGLAVAEVNIVDAPLSTLHSSSRWLSPTPLFISNLHPPIQLEFWVRSMVHPHARIGSASISSLGLATTSKKDPLFDKAAMSSSCLVLLAVGVGVLVLVGGGLSQSANLCGTKANGRYPCSDCSASADRGASFEANVLRFQAALQRMAAAADAGFLNATFHGDGDAAEVTVYGLAMCFADAEPSDCSACLAGAASELPVTRCAARRDMVLWYAHCLVRYDNAAFFGVADTSPARRFDVPNPNNFSDPARLGDARRRLAGRMLPAAAASPARSAYDGEEVTANATLHGLAQCTDDLPADECSRCLASLMDWHAGCCADMDGVRLIGASCYLRYELLGFAPTTPPIQASPPASVPGNPPNATGNENSSSSRKKSRIYIVAGAVGALALLCIFLAGGFLCYKQKRRGSPTIESFLQHQHPRRYSYSEVKRMTESFAHKLGQGGNGVVYRGRLPDGREVAVKMLNGSGGGGGNVDGEEFVNEVASISRTSHVNVVTLLGFCLSGRRRGLVYEYMPNGSLERLAFGRGEGELGWEKLFDIAVGVARGLEYLHRGCNAHIVHFDIKPHNILLDRHLRPKIADFGLAKLCPQKQSTISVPIAGARGTAGYIAPEVFSRRPGTPVTSKADVYSYGMVVLEMAGARRRCAVDVTTATSGSEASSSSKYFPRCLYGAGLDRFCANACEVDGDGEAVEVVRKMVIVGLWCVQTSPGDRPSMSRVVEMLEQSAELQLPPS